MTASIIDAGAASPSSSFGRLAGFRALVRKDTTDWVRGRRAWVILVISVLFMLLSAANGWITRQIVATFPDGSVKPENLGSMAPVDNFLAAITGQIFVIATIFVAGSLLAREREAGTLAWVASKPVTRASIWLSKWTTTTVITAVVAGIVPLVATMVLVTALYGPLPIELVVGVAAGLVATIAFFAAVGLGLGTVLPGQAATIAAGFAVFAILPIIGGILPVEQYLPTAMLSWPAAALSGASVSFVTPVAWLVVTAAIVGLAVRRTARMEL
jgi:ABC-type transport system involved in multi-copper enzyme maturation permease subunit